MEDKKVLLSVKDLEVKFRVRGRILTAIRGISLDIYENESIAIVGESGSGKSVFTKTFAGMLDSNGFVSNGDLIFNDKKLATTNATPTKFDKFLLDVVLKQLNKASKLEFGAEIYKQILALEDEKKEKYTLAQKDQDAFEDRLEALKFKRTEAYNLKLTLNARKERDKIRQTQSVILDCDRQIKALEKERDATIRNHRLNAMADKEFHAYYNENLAKLKSEYIEAIAHEIDEQTHERNAVLGKEIYLSVGRYPFRQRMVMIVKLIFALRKAMKLGIDLSDETQLNAIFDPIAFRVKFLEGTTETELHGVCAINLAKIKYTKDWQQIRGSRIATVFQDPMTSLNPIITIGKQISSIIMKHQNCSEAEARRKAIELMRKVGIPNAENRYDDYPFQYSGGMRQRIVIAIALSCQPKILICDEPTTALDVTIQAQILKLIKDLQKEFNYTIVFITHDLGVVANIADRVAVLYAGQIIELGTVEEVFYDPRHPYTWALLSSLPQLAEKNTELYSISGTPPSLYNKIVGDPFAPRNPYCLKIDTLKEAPWLKVEGSDTHYAKTWLLDPRAPKIEKPEIIKDIHARLLKAFNIEEVE